MNGFSETDTRDFFDGYDTNGKAMKLNGQNVENTFRRKRFAGHTGLA
jgi:type I restriction enzyme R subunit